MAISTLTQRGLLTDKQKNKNYIIDSKENQNAQLVNIYREEDNELLLIFYKDVKEKKSYIKGDDTLYDIMQHLITKTRAVTNKRTFEGLCEYGKKNIYVAQHESIEYRNLEATMITIDNKITDVYYEDAEWILDLKAEEINKPLIIKKPENLDKFANKVYIEPDEIPEIIDLKEIRLRKDLSWLEGKDYRIINDLDEFEEFVKELEAHDGPIAVDTETTGLSINRFPETHPKRDRLVGICISHKEDFGVYLPVEHKLFANLPKDYVLQRLKPILEKKHIVTHFGVFDWKVFWTYGIDLNIVDDTYILQYMIDTRAAKATKGLKELAKIEFGIDQLELEDFFVRRRGRKKTYSFDFLPYEAVRCYGPADADLTLKLRNLKRPQLLPSMYHLYAMETNLMKRIAFTEYYGFRIDLEELDRQMEEAIQKRAQIEEEIYQLAGYKFKITSPQQLAKLLYEEMGAPVLVYTKSNPPKPSTGKSALEQLAAIMDENDKPKYPIVHKILEYREYDKLITAFYVKMKKDNIDGFIFPRYNQCGAESGRIAGYEPNLQQVPSRFKKFRKIFIPDDENHYIIDVDYSQIEARVMAAIAGQEDLIEEFKDPYMDFHTSMAARLYNVPQKQVTSDMRSKAKALNFGIPYGMGDRSLAIKIFKKATAETIEEARRRRLAYLDSVPMIRDMFTKVKDFAQVRGYVETYFRRRRYFTNINSPDPAQREAERRKAGNTIIQGTAADILKYAYCRVAARIEKEGLLDKMRVAGSVHDQLVFIVHKSINPWRAIKIIKESLELNIKGFPPLYTTCAVCRTWEDGKKDEFEIPEGLARLRMKEVEQGMHMEPMEDPATQVLKEINEYAKEEIKKFAEKYIINNKISVQELSKHTTNEIEAFVKKYFNNNMAQVLRDIFGDTVEVIESGIATVKEEEEDIDLSTDDEDEDVIIVEDSGIGMAKSNLRLPEQQITTADSVYYNETKIYVFNGVCYINIDGITKQGLLKLKQYLESNSREHGYKVNLLMQGQLIETKYKLLYIDRDYIEALINDGRLKEVV